MTKDERINAINGIVSEETNTAPTDSAVETKETNASEERETASVQSDEKESAVNPVEDKPKETEAKDETDKGGKKKGGLYSQERANHAFAKQTKQIERLKRELAEANERLKGYEGKDKESFVDKVSGKLDEDGFRNHEIKKAVAEERVEAAKQRVADAEDECNDAYFYDRCDRELGEDSEAFKEQCNKVVADDGATHLQVFTMWLEKNDPNQVVLGRVASSRNGIKILKTLMNDKDKRLEMLQQGTPYQLEKFLDRMEDGFATKKQSFKDAWKSRNETRQKEEPKPALKPTGSAFQGKQSNQKVVHDKEYRRGLLL